MTVGGPPGSGAGSLHPAGATTSDNGACPRQRRRAHPRQDGNHISNGTILFIGGPLPAVMLGAVARAVAANNVAFLARNAWFIDACGDLLDDAPIASWTGERRRSRCRKRRQAAYCHCF